MNFLFKTFELCLTCISFFSILQAPVEPNKRALLDTICYAEGTWKGGCSYNTYYGGGDFDNTKPHPGIVNNGSAAGGAYQFMPFTWERINQGENLPMMPETQDDAAIKLIKNRGVNPNAELTPETFLPTIDKLAPEWASLPTLRTGRSYYRQPSKSGSDLQDFYYQRLAALKEQNKEQEIKFTTPGIDPDWKDSFGLAMQYQLNKEKQPIDIGNLKYPTLGDALLESYLGRIIPTLVP